MDNSASLGANNAIRNVTNESDLKLPSIKMFTEEPNFPVKPNDFVKKGERDHFALNPYQHNLDFNNRMNNSKAAVARKPPLLSAREKQQQKAALNKKKKSQEKRQESKAAKTLSAILLSFIITWTPYNIRKHSS